MIAHHRQRSCAYFKTYSRHNVFPLVIENNTLRPKTDPFIAASGFLIDGLALKKHLANILLLPLYDLYVLLLQPK